MFRRLSAIAVVFPLFAPPAAALDGGRIQQLYENHCLACHESAIHIRERSKVRSLTDIEGWVRHWEQALELHWDDETVDGMVRFLNYRHYRYGYDYDEPG